MQTNYRCIALQIAKKILYICSPMNIILIIIQKE